MQVQFSMAIKTQARVLSTTLTHGNSKNKVKQRNRGSKRANVVRRKEGPQKSSECL